MRSKHQMPFGADVGQDGVRFALWAPSAAACTLTVGEKTMPMVAAGQGWFKAHVAEAKAGDRYGYGIDGDAALVPDPVSRFQDDDLDRRSTIVDPCAYEWQDDAWQGRSWNEVVLSEVHLGTVTPEGTYSGLEARLQHFVDAGITAIELMPIAETSGLRTWGYDGVLPYAPNNSYGHPDGLKRLIDKAHGLGLMVFLDVVYNHFGPTGNFLNAYAKSFFTKRHETPWGAGINFDGEGEASDVVREFFVQNSLYWLREYHFDGLRFDAVHAILDDSPKHVLDELAERIREALPQRHVHLVLENEANEARRLTRDGDGSALSYDAQWDDDIHHCWHVLLTGEHEGYYADFGGDTVARLGRCLAEGFAYQGDFSGNLERRRGEKTTGLPPQAFVAFLQNHDQIGNRALGERLTELADPDKLRLARAVLLLSPQIPMLFMGDEWGARTRFQFFVNFEHEPELEEAVRQGRAREFEKFQSFGSQVPDPTASATFEGSKLDWAEIDRAPYSTILDETRALLTTRRREIVPLLATSFIEATYERHGEGGLDVVWRFEAGSLRLVANFAEVGTQAFDMDPDEEEVWRSQTLSGDASNLGPWQARLTLSDAS